MNDVGEILLHTGFIRQKGYWEKKLSPGMEMTELHPAYKIPRRDPGGTGNVDIHIPGDIGRRLVSFGKGSDLSVYIVLLTALKLLIFRCTGNRDITVVSPVYIKNITEETINESVYIRDEVDPDGTFTDLLLGVRKSLLEAYENQDYPSDKLLQYLFHAVPVTNSDGAAISNITCLLGNIHDPRMVADGNAGLIFSFEREEERIGGRITYPVGVYEEEFLKRFSRYFTVLLENCLRDVKARIADISFASGEETRRLIYEFNDTAADYPRDKTIHQLFEEQVERTPDDIAVIEHYRLSYKELNERSNQLARSLRAGGVTPDSVVVVMTTRSTETVIGMLAVLKAGGAFLPLDPQYPGARKRFILEDSEAKVLLTQQSVMEKDGAIYDIIPSENRILLDNGDIYSGDASNLEGSSQPGDLAYIIYTSGTTGRPKGVMVEHRGVVNYITWAARQYLKGRKLDFPLYTSISFDLTVTSIFTPLVTGGAVVVYSGEDEESGLSIEKVIDENRVGVVKLTPSHLKLIGHKKAGTSSRIERFIVGGEDFKTDLAKNTRENFPSVEIYNEYGPTEATVGCMIYKYDPAADNRRSVPIGKPADNLRVYILDGQLKPVPLGGVGELFISGAGLARGYLKRPELTDRRFLPNPFIPGERMYRTGDLARMLLFPGNSMNVEFLGRLDQQVKIRGYRIEPGEIRERLVGFEGVKEAVIVAREDKRGEKTLCAYFVPEHGVRIGASALKDHLSAELPDHMVPVSYTSLEKIPLTPNGKVDERALPEAHVEVETEYAAPRSELEKTLAGIWSDVLNLDDGVRQGTSKRTRTDVGIDDNFFQLGGHSLKATLLVSRIHKILGARVPLTEIFKTPTIRGLAAVVESAAKDKYISIEKVEEKDFYPLSSAQKRLFLLHRMDPGGTVYNIPLVMRLEGKLDREKLKTVFNRLIRRHETLRTSFRVVDDEPVQLISGDVELEIEIIDTRGETDDTGVIERFIRPFDLTCSPLLRVGLIAGDAGEHLLVLDMHHIVTDGVSMEILAREFMTMYGGEAPPPLPLQYKDYARWQNHIRQRQIVKEQEAYWTGVLSGELPVLMLPLDFPRPDVQRFEGASLGFELSQTETRELKELARREDATLFMTLLAVFTLWLSRLSGQDDIIVGSPIAARRHADLAPIVGMFVNTLALRNYPYGDKSFRRFLAEVKERTLAAYENQEYPFEELVDVLKVPRDAGRNPLFDAAFVLQNMDSPTITIPGMTLSPYPHDTRISRFDLTLNCEEAGGKISGTIEYCTALFTRDTMERFFVFFRRIGRIAALEPGIKLSGIEIISDEEKKTVLEVFNDTGTGYPAHKTIHGLFEEQAEKTPDKIAVVYETDALTYNELDRRSGNLAARLRQEGVDSDVPVGLTVEHSLEMVVGIIGILKAGGAYLPINPDFPEERKRYMLEDSKAGVLLSELSELSELSGNVEAIQPTPPTPLTHPTHLCYIMYTSGSTGIPRGVMVNHRNVVRLVKNTNFVEFRFDDRILQTGALEFDASTFEIWGSLLNGLTLCLVEKRRILNPRLLKIVMYRYDITTIWMTSPLFNQMVDADVEIFGGLTNLLVGGDILSPTHINRLKGQYPRVNIINGYGPTENTTFSATFRIDREYEGSIPIGGPIAHSTVFIVDRYGNLQPPKVPGELIVGGDGVARGYLNNPESTAERFSFNRTYRSYKSYRTYYKTGDRARWQANGTIEFLGRIDHQVKIRGFRVELGEIESRLLKIEGVREAVVIVKVGNSGEKYLCAYTAPAGKKSEELKSLLAQSLPKYMVPAYFISLEKMPLNPNGKIDRDALPAPGTVDGGMDAEGYAAPRDELERRLARLWCRLLAVSRVGIHDNFFDIGGHSLKALHLLNALQKEFDIKIDFQDIFVYPTIASLSNVIRNSETTGHFEIPYLEEKDYYELSYAQKRLWLLYEFAPDDPAFNLPVRLTLTGPVETAAVRKAFELLAKRHEAFRTYFKPVKGEPVQFIRPPGTDPVNLETVDISHLSESERALRRNLLFEEESILPFTLDRPPLYRVKLIKCRESEHDIVLTMHHIITDGWSMEVLEREFISMYSAITDGKEDSLDPAPLPLLHVRYRDYAGWHNRVLTDKEGMQAARTFWETQLSGNYSRLELPYDFPAGGIESKESAAYRIVVPDTVMQRLITIGNEQKASLFMVLLAAYNLVLSRLSGQEEILLAVPGAARQHDDLKNIIGLFVNTLILKNTVHPHETFIQLLERVQANMMHVLDYQGYPLELICSEYRLRYPDISVFFNMSIFGSALEGNLEDMESYHIDRVQNAKFDIVSYVGQYKNAVEISTHYYKKRFKPVTVEKMMRMYLTILENISVEPGKELKEYFKSSGKRKIALK